MVTEPNRPPESQAHKAHRTPVRLDPAQIVDLDQVAALCQMSLASMRRRHLQALLAGAPVLRAGRGKRKHLWYWPTIRPWLVVRFDMPGLPEMLPPLAGEKFDDCETVDEKANN
ncbi:MAG: hypothetical protein JO270_19445 [Acidobacteriaceae bacterium]|nr:hypothetical protein [Acidobacteriaceae bacterium]